MKTSIQKGMAILLLGIAIRLVTSYSAAIANTPEPASSPSIAALQGLVIDDETKEAIGFVSILVQQANRSITSDDKGVFILTGLPAGQFTVKTFRIGYRNITTGVQLQKGDTTRIILSLTKAPLTTQELVVEAERTGSSSMPGITPALLLSDRKLRQNLGKTIAETLDYEPGISQRTMGPAPARPVLRGLEGDRLLLLEDGETIGDLSATSADHAVVIEPVTAERIEIIRGPEALVYGSNTLGGVINVVRGSIPVARVSHCTGSIGAQNETVNRGLVTGGDLTMPLGIFTGRCDASYRRAYDINTPAGTLPNTGIMTINASTGIGLARDWGSAGISASVFESSYGIPPDPNGGHPGGVDINMERSHEESKLELLLDNFGIQRIELRQSYSRYYHEELEASGSLGMNFGVLTNTGTARVYLQNRGVFKNGIAGINGQFRDFASGGLSFTPAAREYHAAAYYYQQAQWEKVTLSGAVRYDFKTITPEEEKYSRTTGFIRKRRFEGYSAAAALHYRVIHNVMLRAALIRTFRAPGIEELFSEGPHLAAYSYDIGNANLSAESGIGAEVSAEYNWERVKVQITLFRNKINNYLLPVNTGEKSWRRADLYVYKYLGEPALMQGFEASWDLPVYQQLFMSGSLGYVHGEFTSNGLPIPRIPPLEGKMSLRYVYNSLNLGATVNTADKQTRLGEFEKKTAGYATFSLYLQYYISGGHLLHTVTVTLGNITDTEYRKHLNRVKEIIPEPGRNVKILYKVFF